MILSAGGIICVGRGAYKEYLSGVHEGLLGPLEKPQSVIDEETKLAEEKKKEKRRIQTRMMITTRNKVI